MTLTKKWKKGELEGEYYIETTNGEIYNVEFQNSISVKKKKLLKVKSFKGYVHKKTVKEVLAPVPSYDRVCRLNHLENDFIKTHERINKLEKENQQLKELLKECLNEIHELAEIQDNRSVTIYNFLSAELVTKIDNAIGEK